MSEKKPIYVPLHEGDAKDFNTRVCLQTVGSDGDVFLYSEHYCESIHKWLPCCMPVIPPKYLPRLIEALVPQITSTHDIYNLVAVLYKRKYEITGVVEEPPKQEGECACGLKACVCPEGEECIAPMTCHCGTPHEGSCKKQFGDPDKQEVVLCPVNGLRGSEYIETTSATEPPKQESRGKKFIRQIQEIHGVDINKSPKQEGGEPRSHIWKRQYPDKEK